MKLRTATRPTRLVREESVSHGARGVVPDGGVPRGQAVGVSPGHEPSMCVFFFFFFFFDGSDKTSKVRSYDTSKILLIDSNDHAL